MDWIWNSSKCLKSKIFKPINYFILYFTCFFLLLIFFSPELLKVSSNILSKPRQSQGLLYIHRCQFISSLSHWVSKVASLVQKLQQLCRTWQICCFPKTNISVVTNQPTVEQTCNLSYCLHKPNLRIFFTPRSV